MKTLRSVLLALALTSAMLATVVPSRAAHSVPVVTEARTPHSTEGAVEIHGTPAEVYAVLTNYPGWPALFSDVSRISVKSGGREDAIAEIGSRAFGHAHTFRFRNQRDRRVHFEAIDAHGISLWGDLELEATGPATTRVRAKLYADATGVAGWFVSEKSLREKRSARLASDLASLRRRFAA